jgi:poly-gamma-glutamate capsule biosynthesis protein CapA/YwtB (metallophosphatase superfamily)
MRSSRPWARLSVSTAVLLPLVCVWLGVGAVACADDTQRSASDAGVEDGADETGSVTDDLTDPKPPVAKHPLAFSAGCEVGDHVTLAAVGDVLLHGPLQDQALSRDGKDGNERFDTLWDQAGPLLAKATVRYANFEGAANSAKPFTSYPQFNYNPLLIPALQQLGITVVSTANNHALDSGSAGVTATIGELTKYGLPFTGTSTGGAVAEHTWHATTEATGEKGETFRVAWLACSYASNSIEGATNGIPDKKTQVLNCGRDKAFLLQTIGELAGTHDAVVVTPHWGLEYELTPRAVIKTLAQEMVDAGALVVFGNHPHVPQPWEKLVSKRDGREAMVLYSLGNFVSNQVEGISKVTATWKTNAIYVGLTRKESGEVVVNGARYTPLYMQRNPIRTILPAESAQAGASGKATVAFSKTMYHPANFAPATEPLDTRAILTTGEDGVESLLPCH